MSQQLGGQQVFILREGTTRTRGKEVQRSNIMAAKAIASAVRSTLGPRGMDKMLVNQSGGDIVITNDGATILGEIAVKHPGAKMVIEVARTQDKEVGDGTTTAVILVGALMEQAESMLEPDRYCRRLPHGHGESAGDSENPGAEGRLHGPEAPDKDRQHRHHRQVHRTGEGEARQHHR
jgi:hypothetical protein